MAKILIVDDEPRIRDLIRDIMMPFMDGMTCLREMRTRKIMTPVIMLTARSEEYDKLAGLEGGADDYVVKPFSPRELVARVKAVLARTMPKPAENSGVFRQPQRQGSRAGSPADPQRVRPAGLFGQQQGHRPEPRENFAAGVELRLLRRGPHRGHPHQNAARPSGPLPQIHRYRVGHRV